MLPRRTERLILRLLRPDEAEAYAAHRSDPEVARYVPWSAPFPVEEARKIIDGTAGRAFDVQAQRLTLAVERAADGVFIGEAMLRHPEHDPRQAIIGYALARHAHGQGYATEIVRELQRRVFGELQLHRIAAVCDERNAASCRVLEKCGFRREARFVKGSFFKGEWVTEIHYGMLREEWR